MESAVDTADSMKSRGYGLKKRTAYSLYRFFMKDILFALLMIVCDAAVAAAFFLGALDYSYYPYLSFGTRDTPAVAAYTAFGVICFAPLIIDIREDVKWKYIRLKT